MEGRREERKRRGGWVGARERRMDGEREGGRAGRRDKGMEGWTEEGVRLEKETALTIPT